MQITAILLLCLGFFLFLGAIIASLLWRRYRRGIESPVRDLMLRPPGYTLQNRIVDMEGDSFTFVFGCFAAPILIGLSPVFVVGFIDAPDWISLTALGLGLGLLVVAYIVGFRLARKRLEHSADCNLGLRGELLVAEFLRPLEREGYRVFHDFPLQQQRKDANIDHIVVGKTGVWVVETKMRRKHRKVKTTRDNYRVEFTGDELVYPTFRDRHGIDQTKANTRHLEEFLRKETGHRIPVSGMLVLPGWYVHQSGNGSVQVTGHKTVANRIDRGRLTLDDDRQLQVARAIEKVCRDVKV